MRALGPGAGAAERDAWLAMRAELWPESSLEDHRAEAEAVLRMPQRGAVLLADDAAGAPVGFAEVSLREVAEGCASSPVGYLEGWFVAEPFRRRGVGRALVDAAAAWARERGATEMASDAELDNRVSQRAHAALGFEELGPVVLYRRSL